MAKRRARVTPSSLITRRGSSKLFENIGSGGRDRTADLGVMNSRLTPVDVPAIGRGKSMTLINRSSCSLALERS